MTPTDRSLNSFRRVLKVALYVSVLGQVVLLVLWYLFEILPLWKMTVGRPFPLVPLNPARSLVHVMIRPRGSHDSRFFLVGFLFNSLIYTALWLVGAWAVRGLRAARQHGGES